MCSCSNEAKFASFYPVNEQPVRLNMTFSTVLQGAFEVMIFILRRQFFSIGQTPDNIFQLIDIFMAFDYPINIPFELCIASD